METLLIALKFSLIITAIYATTWRGMIFSRSAQWIQERIALWMLSIGYDSKKAQDTARYLVKPLFGCLICMSSFWTIILYPYLVPKLDVNIVYLMLTVCGINVIISGIISSILPYE